VCGAQTPAESHSGQQRQQGNRVGEEIRRIHGFDNLIYPLYISRDGQAIGLS
jgi:hypothetical protein